MRILFAGTPDIAVPSLKSLAGRHEIVGVLTNPDRAGGRGRALVPPPVKTAALRLGLEVLQPDRLDEVVLQRIKALEPDILVVVAYGKIFKNNFLSLFPAGGINLHPSLLPKYRGCSPIQAAILAGDEVTGITIQRIALEMDSGAILARKTIELDGRETGGSLTGKAAGLGAELLVRVLGDLESGTLKETPQDTGGVSFCYRIRKEDGRIDWSAPAQIIERKVRAYNPWPGGWTTWGDKRLVIFRAAVQESTSLPAGGKTPGKVLGVDKGRGFLIQTGRGVLSVEELQLQAKKVMDWKSFLNGNGGFPGSVLGSNT